MASLFDKMKEAAKEGIVQSLDPQAQEERRAEKAEKKAEKEQKKLDSTAEGIEAYMGNDEKLLAYHTFVNDKLYATDRKLIYVVKLMARETMVHIIPYDTITAYTVVIPTGMAMKSKLKVYAGTDNPIIDVEAVFTDPTYSGITKILADNL